MSFWKQIYFSDANSPIIEQIIIFHDHSIIVIISIIIFLLLIIINLINLKKMNYNLRENQLIEFIWTTLPVLLLIFIAVPSLRLLYLIEEIFTPLLTIKIVGHQWYWRYEYRDFNLNFDSFIKQVNQEEYFRLLETDNRTILPINCLTRILVTSADVIHSWTIPRIGIKSDAVPGRLNQINIFCIRPGIFFGQCSEICGSNHSFMPINLKIVSLRTFKKYLNNQN